jgi:hypothetical protein
VAVALEDGTQSPSRRRRQRLYAVTECADHFCFWQIVLQKSQNAVRLNFRQTPNQAATVDRCSLKRAREVASELITERSGPPHQRSIAACTVWKIWDR